jgi:hypothetical protein
MAISIKRVLTSGLIAGIFISLSAVTMVPVVGNEMDNVLASRGLPPLSNAAIVYFCCISLVFGISLIFLYAILRPQFGSRIKTVIIASIIVWVLAYLINNISLCVYGFMPVRLVVIGTVWGLLELLLAGFIASKLYERMKTK